MGNEKSFIKSAEIYADLRLRRLQDKRHFNHTTEAKLGGDDAQHRPKGETSERMRIKIHRTHGKDPTALERSVGILPTSGKRNIQHMSHTKTRRKADDFKANGFFNHRTHTTEAKLGGDDAKHRPKGETSERMRITTHRTHARMERREGILPALCKHRACVAWMNGKRAGQQDAAPTLQGKQRCIFL